MDAHWVETEEELAKWCDRLSQCERIAVDTEANSMFAYFERICLVQVSIPGEDLLIDPFAVDLAPLGEVFANPNIQKILHGADYDILSFKRSEGFVLNGLFDTMLAAKILGWERCGLAPLLAEHFDHAANKAFQRYDWGQRPLSDDALAYARYDTHFLLELAQLQSDALAEAGREELFARACERQTQVEPKTRTFDPDGYWKFKGARDLDEPARSVLRAVFAWRDTTAQELDRPPFRVLPESAMMGLARQQPADARAVGQVRSMPKPIARRHAPALVELISKAKETPCPRPVRAKRSPADRDVGTRMDALRGWRKAEAAKLGVDPEFVLDKAALVAVAEAGDVARLGPWERERYANSMKAALIAATDSAGS